MCPRHARYGITKGDEPMNDSRPYIECGDLFKIYKRADIEVVALRGLDLFLLLVRNIRRRLGAFFCFT